MNAIHALSQLSYGPVIFGQGIWPDVVRAIIEENEFGHKVSSSCIPLLLTAHSSLLTDALPSPVDAIDTRQLVEISPQRGPISAGVLIIPQTIATHELLNLRGPVEHGLHVTRG